MTHEELLALCGRAATEIAAVSEPITDRGVTSVEVATGSFQQLAAWLRTEGPFELLADLSVIDWFRIEPDDRRYCVGAMFASPLHAARVQVRVFVGGDEPHCPSLSSLWLGAIALEREAFDFFGVVFDGHPNLTRIFMPEDWEGHPQRKDYPLGGIDVRYEHGQAVTPPDERARRETTTSGFPGRTS